LNEPIPQNPLGVRVFGYKDSELLRPLSEEGGVDDDSCTRNRWSVNCGFVAMNLFSDPSFASMVFCRQQLYGLSLVKIFFENLFSEGFLTSGGGKTMPATETEILLDSSMTTVLFGATGRAKGALFYSAL